MAIDVRVPTTGNAGEDVVVLDWAAAVGSSVRMGELLVTLETAKATVEIESPADGVLLAIRATEGDEVAEHAVLGVIGEPGEALADASGPAPADAGAAVSAVAAVPGTVSTTPAAPGSEVAAAHRAGITASPRAALLAARNGLDLAGVAGTGPAGRIIVPDVLAARDAAAARPLAPAPAGASVQPSGSTPATGTPAPLAGENPFELVPVRGARKVTAQRMHESLQSTAQVTLTRYADADRLFAYAARLKEASATNGQPKIGINDLLLFAIARAVVRHPEANAAFGWDGIRRYRNVNLGFAVDTGQALLVPVIPLADTLSPAQIAAAARGSIDKALAGRLTTEEMDGGTFTVSNLGGLGVHWFTPVLNPPQACILGIGAAHQSHKKAPRHLPLSLTFDHRALDGAAAARLLADIATTIESVDVLSAYTL